MKKLFERLKEERERLKLGKGEMAHAGGVANSTYTNYETGEREPVSAFYQGIANIGADINYIITGIKTGDVPYPTGGLNSNHVLRQEYVSEREHVLLDNYRASSDEGKRAVEAASAALAQPQKKRGMKM